MIHPTWSVSVSLCQPEQVHWRLFPAWSNSCCRPSTDVSPRMRRRRVNFDNLRQLQVHHQPKRSPEQVLSKMALINARSLVNKTFILNDFVVSNDLDMLLITETWLRPGDLAPLTELLPQDYLFLNSPRSTGRGGGLVSVFENKFSCQSLSTNAFKSFELQLFRLNAENAVVVALIYRPPKSTIEFISEFAEFLSELVTYNDRLLILGDFNIHICCGFDSLSKEFVNLLTFVNGLMAQLMFRAIHWI